MRTNGSLRKSRVAKKDEFYTQYSDIEKELTNYTKQLRGKAVYCNCDNPLESNFVRYFIMNFNELGIKRLIATHYADQHTGVKPYKLVINELIDNDNDGVIGMDDFRASFRSKKNSLTHLTGDGDFRSAECIELLKEADVVITNPPFSIWREFAELVLENGKQFIALGTIQAANYTTMLDGIINGTIQAGYTSYNKGMKFVVPEHYDSKRVIDGKKIVKVPVCWWTNLVVTNRKPIELHKHYSSEEYPKYESRNSKGRMTDSAIYDAVNIDRVDTIPCDYDGLMGVPVTILGKIDYSQFEVIGKINNGFICGRKVFTRLIIKLKSAT